MVEISLANTTLPNPTLDWHWNLLADELKSGAFHYLSLQISFLPIILEVRNGLFKGTQYSASTS
jgi:hypothetical protein